MEAGTPLPLVRRFPLDVLNLMAAYVGLRCRWCCEGRAVLVKAENGPYDWVCIDCVAALLPDETPRYVKHKAAYSSISMDVRVICGRALRYEESLDMYIVVRAALDAQDGTLAEREALWALVVAVRRASVEEERQRALADRLEALRELDSLPTEP